MSLARATHLSAAATAVASARPSTREHAVSRPHPTFARRPVLAVALAAALAGCSSVNTMLQGDKVDYKSSGGKSVSLEVPPDLTQLSKDSRYQPVGGTISASTLQGPAQAASAPATASVAPKQVGEVRLERAGGQRWLVTKQTPEQLWPQLQAFWQERGFALDVEQRDAGWMETQWNENRAKLPQDFIRRSIGKVFDSVYDTGERDRFRTRLERSADGGTEIYISHRGMVEVLAGNQRDASGTIWQPRPADPELEAIMLQRLMAKLGGQEEQAQQAAAAGTVTAAASPVTPARARLLAGGPSSGLQIDDGFDRAWRRVGLALDRSGFTVEDRDRAQGLYYVRYVDPAQTANKSDPSWFSKLFSFGKKDEKSGFARYRIAVKGQPEAKTLVTVQNNQGAPETGDAAQRILELLVTDLR